MEPESDILKVRKRPGMYVGDTHDGKGLHGLVLGLVSDAVANDATCVEVVLRANGVATVWSSILRPLDPVELARLAALRREAASDQIKAIRLDRGHEAEGGVDSDLCVLNALCDWIRDQVWSGEAVHTTAFRDGQLETAIGPVADSTVSRMGEQGVCTTFAPSGRYFSPNVFDLARLAEALSEIGRRNDVRIGLIDER